MMMGTNSIREACVSRTGELAAAASEGEEQVLENPRIPIAAVLHTFISPPDVGLLDYLFKHCSSREEGTVTDDQLRFFFLSKTTHLLLFRKIRNSFFLIKNQFFFVTVLFYLEHY